MGSESASVYHDDRDEDDDEEYEEAGGGSHMLGFMFGNVDDSGELEVDYLDEDAKEHFDALASKLGSSLIDIHLSGRSQVTPAAGTGIADYDKKNEAAVDYEDIEEQYEGSETDTATKDEDNLMPAGEFFSVVSASNLASSAIDDVDYDDDDKKTETEVHESEAGSLTLTSLISNTGEGDRTELVHNISVDQEIALSEEQPENDLAVTDGVFSSAVGQTEFPCSYSDEEEPALSLDVADVRNAKPLPILYLENGVAVLRFSEIFGVSEPLKMAKGREHKYCVSEDKYTSRYTSVMVEENEEVFLKGSCQVFSTRKPSREATVEHKTFFGDELEFSKLDRCSEMCFFHNEMKGSCLSAEPLRKDSEFDFYAEWQSCIPKEFYSFDQQDWEDKIVWGNSPVVNENLVESFELCGLDSEVPANEERENISKGDCTSFSDENDYRSLVALSAFSVEPFDSGELSTSANDCYTERLYHPQLLRLESRLVMSSSNHFKEQNLDLMKRFKQLTLQNKDLVEGSWIENIIWETNKPIAKSKLIMDLQDEHMVFDILDNNEYEHLHAHAAAVISSRTGKIGEDRLRDHEALSGGQFNIANDYSYTDRRASPLFKSLSKKRSVHGVKIMHSIPACTLQTIKPKLSKKDIANFHRPKAIWYPRENEIAIKELLKLPTKGPMKVILKSPGSKWSKIYVEPEETVSSFKAKASKKLGFSLSEAVKIYFLRKELQDETTIAEQNVLPNSILHLVRTKIHMLPMAHMLSKEKPSLHPPGAFKKKSDLSARDGYVFLMEYCEERPLLLGNTGMGAQLFTYYQKTCSENQNGDLLRNENSGLGTVVILDPADKSPFLGDIKSGCSQCSLETEMYKAPVFLHSVPSTDYLLIRSSKGKLSIRRIDKIHVVGQQEPQIEVMSPGSKNPQNYLWNRLLVHIYREFRTAKNLDTLPCVSAAELSVQFPDLPENLIRKRLKHCADSRKSPNGQFLWVMKRNFNIPPEEELRKMVKPETVCAYESMQSGLYRLKHLGILRLAHLCSPAQLAALSSAMNQLPDEAISLAAASHIERELQTTPWNLSANFVACIGQEKGKVERLEISGVGDPSGQGLGFSYIRTTSKPQTSNAVIKKKQVGTDADLRRLSKVAAREVLLKFNISEEEIGELSRWHRIAKIRKLSSEQAASGVKADPTTTNRFARGQRMSFLQLQQLNREKCQDIWDQQIESLSAVDDFENESDSEPMSDLDSFAGDLENLLDAEEGEEINKGTLIMKNLQSDGVEGIKMRWHPPHVRCKEFIEDDAAEAAELCRLITEGDEVKRKKEKNSRPKVESAGLIRGVERTFSVENAPQVKRSSTTVEQSEGTIVPNNFLSPMINGVLNERVKSGKKNEFVPLDHLNKNVKIMTDDAVVYKSRKSGRENLVCGACGQLGHMRTNKYCPKYRENPEAQLNNINIEIEASEEGKTVLKTKTLKVKHASVDNISDKVAFVSPMTSEKPSTSQPEVGNMSVPEAIKIGSNKTKPDDVKIEPRKLKIVIRPPLDTRREHVGKRITFKLPKTDVINLDQTSEEGADFEYRKTKNIIDLSESSSSLGEEASRNSRMWEEEEKRRNTYRMKEEQERRLFELKKYEEDIRREREEEEIYKTNKKGEQKRKIEVRDDHFNEFLTKKNNRKLPGKSRRVKRKTNVEPEYKVEKAAASKRRKGGVVGLANILEEIVEILQARLEVSYLFLKPVSKKEAPDYPSIVDYPMDLATIKDKVRHLEYKNQDEFRRDVWQIAFNAHLYNKGRNPSIPTLADQLLDICDDLMHERADRFDEEEATISD